MKSQLKKVILLFILFAFCLFVSLPKEIPININLNYIKINKTFYKPKVNFSLGKIHINLDKNLKLGLDLAGGSHLVFDADTTSIASEKKDTALKGVRDVIEKRVNLYGVSEPNVQTSKFQGKDRIIVELPGITDPKKAVDLIGKTAQLVFVEIAGDEKEPTFKPTDLTGADLTSADVVFDQTSGKPAVGIKFSKEGAQKFDEITGRNIKKALPIILDGEVISAPIVQDRISQGDAQITGDFTLEQAKTLVVQLNAGALPIPIKLVEERSVGATLGLDSVNMSVRAGLVGLGMVLLFMFLIYTKLGLVANLALIFFGVITLSAYKLIPVVLTLPGIAGFLLSVGMAVDSNILIFERFKEEKLKRPTPDALEVSFGRAWDSIRDANIATLVTAFILANPLDFQFLHTSGPVRGFAITLALGVAVSLFTGIVVTRNLLRLFIRK